MLIFIFSFKYKFIYFNWRLITLQYCIGFAIHQQESTTSIHVFLRQDAEGLILEQARAKFSFGISSFLEHKSWGGDFFCCFFRSTGLRKSATLWLCKNHYKRLRRQLLQLRSRFSGVRLCGRGHETANPGSL